MHSAYSQHFSLSLLQAISDWQRGGDPNQNKRRGQKLKAVCKSLPETYRISQLVCFRQIALEKGYVWDLIVDDCLSEKISSWTVDIEVAKAFKGGVPPGEQGYQGVVLHVMPTSSMVIVNLRELYKEQTFLEALEKNKHLIQGYSEGAGRYSGSQSEIVLEVDMVTQEDIYSLGGHSSSFEKLVEMAAEITYGSSATDKEKDALLLKSVHLRDRTGAGWLTPEATQRVLGKIKLKAEVLAQFEATKKTTS